MTLEKENAELTQVANEWAMLGESGYLHYSLPHTEIEGEGIWIPKAGALITFVIEDALKMGYRGFLFNGKVIHVCPDDTIDILYERWNKDRVTHETNRQQFSQVRT